VALGLAVLGVLAVAGPGAMGQAPPACQSSAGAVVDAPTLIAYRRTATIKVFANTPEAQAGTLSVVARDPAQPISHPVGRPYSQLETDGGNRRLRFTVEQDDGDAVASLTWTATENGTSCRSQVSATITTSAGKRPFISVGHERGRRIIFGHESPECTQTRVLSWKVEVKGRGGLVRESTADICGKSFHRTGSNPHFTLTARTGVVVFGAKRPSGTYRATYRVLVGGRVVMHGGLRVIVRRGATVVVISIRRP